MARQIYTSPSILMQKNYQELSSGGTFALEDRFWVQKEMEQKMDQNKQKFKN